MSLKDEKFECFKINIQDKIAHIILNRPEKMNSLPISFWSDLPRIINEIDHDALARVIVISSTGKHFSAGMDLSVFSDAENARNEESPKTDPGRKKGSFYKGLLKLQETFNCIDNSRVPVLMAIQGGCIGGAVDFASACDMRYCTEDAFFCIQEINIGMTADVGTFPRLPYLLPMGLVKELAFTGRRMFSNEAKDCGLVNNIFSNYDDMMIEVMKIAKEIAKKSPLAVWGSKEAINYTRGRTIEEGLNQIAMWQTGMYNPHVDMKEALGAQLEKKDPEFEDLYPIKKGFGLL
ncbi:MAG: enoyl-CoA hydratase [Rhodobiaceae bacterium]|nr:enoyl-CoA hydratase [Rhodobiaceae bacterium]|tara:strand:- start:8353 stop:9228 length:876 start_codon:yes stop_codon:yes gene_type:complete